MALYRTSSQFRPVAVIQKVFLISKTLTNPLYAEYHGVGALQTNDYTRD